MNLPQVYQMKFKPPKIKLSLISYKHGQILSQCGATITRNQGQASEKHSLKCTVYKRKEWIARKKNQ